MEIIGVIVIVAIAYSILVIRFFHMAKISASNNPPVSNGQWDTLKEARVAREEVAAMQFELWWKNKGQYIIDDYIDLHKVDASAAVTLRNIAQSYAGHYVVNRLSVHESETYFQLSGTVMTSKRNKRVLQNAIMRHQMGIQIDEEILARFGYNVFDLRMTFVQ
ncbi:hypothetical protein H7200_00910 [Candidatus Saccharibacteria bacterium]|nr:hypothetical protein [Candidatus Saccharibacteria bacterium]